MLSCIGGTYTEFALVALAAMLSPTTLTFSVLTLVLGNRPLRAGSWFYLGAFGVTLAIGIVAAFVLGDAAASRSSTPKTWVAVVDVIAGALLLGYVAALLRRPPDPQRQAHMVARISSVASSPAIGLLGAGAALANPGAFIPLALKAISELDPSTAEYAALWLAFTIIALLPLATALLMLVVAREWTERTLIRVRIWLERRARTVAAVIVVALAVALLRNGIAGLT